LEINQELTEIEFLTEIERGNRYFYQVEIEYAKILNANLKNIVFEECIMCVDFTGTNLSGAKFINCNLKTCSFRNTNLNNVEMDGNLLDSTDFKDAYILDISFENNTYHSYS
jgi:uncharacterized protein YjbI with pentapeptide repeats